VVGMGASGVGVFTALVRTLVETGCAEGAEIFIFDTEERPGAGVAFGSVHDCHLLNMRAGTMSAKTEDPDHFVQWLKTRQDATGGWGASTYVPRRLFADYLQEHFTEVMRDARHAGVRVRTHRTAVSDCREDARGVHLVTATTRFLVDYAFLCLGNLPSTDYLGLMKVPNYVHSMWKEPGLELIDPDATVGIIGTSLTAIDALLRLRDRGHRGHISCFSRRRSLPKVQGPRVVYDCKYVTFDEIQKMTNGFARSLELAEVADLFRRELEEGLGLALDWPRILSHPDTPFKDTLARDIRLAESGQTLWYSILDATSEVIPFVWKTMSPAARETFLSEYLPIWMTFRHCMPVDNARRLFGMARDGTFDVLSGLNSVDFDEESDVFRLAGRRGDRAFAREVSYLVNATGTGFALNRSDSPLVQSMLMRGGILPHPLGGVDVDFETMQLMRGDGSKSERVSCVGPLTRGVHFYTSAFETNLRNGENAVMAAVTHFLWTSHGADGEYGAATRPSPTQLNLRLMRKSA
jgi:uncharacterized NAD(P)/FAD-binding protein YdhS